MLLEISTIQNIPDTNLDIPICIYFNLVSLMSRMRDNQDIDEGTYESVT